MIHFAFIIRPSAFDGDKKEEAPTADASEEPSVLSQSDSESDSDDDFDLPPNLNRVNGPQHYHNSTSEDSLESAEELWSFFLPINIFNFPQTKFTISKNKMNFTQKKLNEIRFYGCTEVWLWSKNARK